MKTPLKYLVAAAALIAIAASQAQNRAPETELRISRLQQAIEQFNRAPRPAEQISPAHERLLHRIVDEVIFLHRENLALRQELETRRAKP